MRSLVRVHLRLGFLLVIPALASGVALGQSCSVAEVVVQGGCAPAPAAPEKSSPRAQERTLLGLIADDRKAAGVRTLTVDDAATEEARRHARDMARRNKLSNDSWYDSKEGRKALGYPSILRQAQAIAPTAHRAHDALMRERTSRDSILHSRTSLVGVGVYIDDDGLWVAEVFFARGGNKVRTAADSETIVRVISNTESDRNATPASVIAAPTAEHAGATSPLLPVLGIAGLSAIVARWSDRRIFRRK